MSSKLNGHIGFARRIADGTIGGLGIGGRLGLARWIS